MRFVKKIVPVLICCILLQYTAFAQPLRIAVAANAQAVIKLLQADFKKRTGISTEAIVGASGKLSTQIENGAPFDVFLSADMEFPQQLYKKGLTLNKPKVYAQGILIVCSSNGNVAANWQRLISSGGAGKIAIANPKTAPYGKAAEEALAYYDLTARAKPNLVYGESISQVNTYITTGVVGVGFTTEAFLYERESGDAFKWMRVDPKSYDKIEQGMVVLNHAKKANAKGAMKFADYMSSAPAKGILKQNGYTIP